MWFSVFSVRARLVRALKKLLLVFSVFSACRTENTAFVFQCFQCVARTENTAFARLSFQCARTENTVFTENTLKYTEIHCFSFETGVNLHELH